MTGYEIKVYCGTDLRATKSHNNLIINPNNVRYLYHVGEYKVGKPGETNDVVNLYKVIFDTNENGILIDEVDAKVIEKIISPEAMWNYRMRKLQSMERGR